MFLLVASFAATITTSIVATPATAQTVVDILPAANGAWGLAYADGFLWVGNDTNGFIEKTDPAAGSVLESIPTPYDESSIPFGANHGVTWDGSAFWVAGDFGKDWLYRIDPSGAVLETIPTPTDAVGGLSWDGRFLLVTTYHPNGTAGVLTVDPADGSIIGSTLPTQGTQPSGIAFDDSDGTLWNGIDDNEGDPERVWNIDVADGFVNSVFNSPAGGPKGIALGAGYLWLIPNNTQGSGRRIYKIDLAGGGTPDILALPEDHDFGITALGAPVSQSQTLRNDGDGDLTISSITTTAPFSYDAQSFPLVIAPAASVTFDVTFDPQVAGNFASALKCGFR